MLNSEHDLQQARQKIDIIDEQIQHLLESRANLAIKIAEIKQQTVAEPCYYQPDREAAVLRQRLKNYTGILHPNDIITIYRAIMTACLSLQKRKQVAFLGPFGTFSHESVLQHFGETVILHPVDSFQAIISAVENKAVKFGVIPIENSSTGMIQEAVLAVDNGKVSVCGEIELKIHQHLLKQNTDHTTITKIYSHPQSFKQCADWLAKHYPYAKQIAVSSNAKAAELAVQEHDAAAIAGDLAQVTYQLAIIAKNIHDELHNRTRFLILQ